MKYSAPRRRWATTLLAIPGATWLHRLCGPLALAAPSVVRAATPSPMLLGVGAHLDAKPIAEIDRQVALAARVGVQLVRWDLQWKYVETERGRLEIRPPWDRAVDRLRAAGMESVLILDYGNRFYDDADKPRSPEAIAAFARYAAFVAAHFKGRVRHYQIWNEWNSKIGKTSRGNAAEYAALARPTYRAIKQVDPGATVIVGGFSSSSNDSIVGYGVRESTFEDLLGLDVPSFGDVLALHPYVVYRDGPWRSLDGFNRLLTATMRRIRATPGLEDFPIYLTEIGWTSAVRSERGVTREEQARNLESALETARRLGIAATIVYELIDGNDDPKDPEGNFGLFDFRGAPKPAFDAVVAGGIERPVK